MSVLRPSAAKVFHQISKRQQAVPLPPTTNLLNEQPPDPQPSRSISRPSFKTKRLTPPSRQSRRSRNAPRRQDLDIDLTVFGNNLPSSPFRDLQIDPRWRPDQEPTRCGSARRPYIGVTSKLRTRRLMTPATPMTPMTTVRTMVSEECRSKRLTSPVIGASRSVMTPMTQFRTMATEASTSKVCGFSVAPKTNHVATVLAPMTMTTTTSGPNTSAGPFYIQTRTYASINDCTEKILRGRKPCFAVKKLRPKKPPIDWTSPCACDYQKKNQDRCSKWKCRPSYCACPQPKNYMRVYKCPKRVKKIRMRKLAVKKRKMRLGYKVCTKPPKLAEPFWCFPKPPPPPPPPEPTPKRCPCFKPRELEPPPPCKKIRCAIDGDCKKKPRKLDASCPCKKNY